MEILLSDYENVRQKIFSDKCLKILRQDYPTSELLLTHSCTGALEMIALLLDIKPGDEIIMPSFTFVATAVPFVLRGAVPVFVDIDPESLNMNELLVERAITPKTKAIICMHYGGFSADVALLREICDDNGLALVEDAAMGFGVKKDGKPLGSFGDFGVISFDVTKHITAIQGGMLIINNTKYVKRAQYIYHVGTNRTEFLDGEKTYFEWVDVGSKYQMPEMSAAVLEVQLRKKDALLKKRNDLVGQYWQILAPIADKGLFKIMSQEKRAESLHLFYLLLPSRKERDGLMHFLQANGVESLFHYIPLHTSHYGRECSRFVGDGDHTSNISGRLLRLPLHVEMEHEDVELICGLIAQYSMPA